MTDCVFCRILAGELPASFVYRDDRCAAFMDIQPVNAGHLLVVPVRHASFLADMDGAAAAELMRVGHAAAAALRASELRCEGVNFFLADGEAAMQEVFTSTCTSSHAFVAMASGSSSVPSITRAARRARSWIRWRRRSGAGWTENAGRREDESSMGRSEA